MAQAPRRGGERRDRRDDRRGGGADKGPAYLERVVTINRVAKVVFDRGGNTYTGRIAAFADAAREAGLEF